MKRNDCPARGTERSSPEWDTSACSRQAERFTWIRFHIMVAVILLAIVPTLRAETRPAERVWILGSEGNYYGLAQWDDSDASRPGANRKRTVVYFGTYQYSVHQPAAIVACVGILALSSLVLIPLSIGSTARKHRRHDKDVA